jgi:hypothetical protein
VQQLGIDPVHFGLIMVLNLMIGLLHPPMGMVLFVLARVSRLSFERTTIAILPWLVPLLVSLALITYVPQIALWLQRNSSEDVIAPLDGHRHKLPIPVSYPVGAHSESLNPIVEVTKCSPPPPSPFASIPTTMSSSHASSSSAAHVLRDENVTVSGLIPPGHKVATRAIAKGQPVKRYNQIIGFASRDIVPGQQVHLNNLAMGEFARDYAIGADAKPTQYAKEPATFMGIVRKDGINKVASRRGNYIGLLSTVNCSATVVRAIADHFRTDREDRGALRDYPNVDGVVALAHGTAAAWLDRRADRTCCAARSAAMRSIRTLPGR